MRIVGAAIGALLLSCGTATMPQKLSYEGAWGAGYWSCVERVGERAMRGPLPVEQAVQSAFDACKKKRPKAVRQLRAQVLIGDFDTPEAAEALVQSSEASIRRNMSMHFTEMRKIPGFKRTNAPN